MRSAHLLSLLSMGLPLSAAAQPTSGLIAPSSATSEAVAAAKSEGDRLLAQAGAAGLFDNETGSDKSGAIRLRHKASGMLCVFNPGKTYNQVNVSPSPVRGDDVGCTSEGVFGIHSTFITRTKEEMPPLVAKEISPMLQRFKGQVKGDVDVNFEAKNNSVPARNEPRKCVIVGFSTTNTYERAVFFRTGEWVVEGRYTSPLQFSSRPELLDRSTLIYVIEREHHIAPTGN